MRARARADQDVVRVARLDRDPRDRAVVGDGERARRRAPSASRRRSSCRGRARPRCRRSRCLRRCRRRSSCRSRRSGRRRSSRSRSSGSRRRSASRTGSAASAFFVRQSAAAGRAHVEGALLRLALRVDGQRRHAARPLGRLDERLRAEPVDVERVGADEVPLRAQLRRRARWPRCSPRSRPGSRSMLISSPG